MKEELITFETAILAKEKGFNPDTMHYYHGNSDAVRNGDYDNGPIYYNTDKDYTGTTSASSQSLLQRWIREVHGLNIGLVFFKSVPRSETKHEYWEWRIHYTDQYGRGDTYETALEAALQTALKLII